MRVIVLAKPDRDYSRAVTMFMADFTRQTGKELEVLNPETREGDSFCRTYDIVEYPAVIALSDSGQMQSIWRGQPLPTINEISYYVSQN